MEALANPHWEAVPDNLRQILETLATAVPLEPFYLAGGTALVLRLGHRMSVDLDFFGDIETFEGDRREMLVRAFKRNYEIEVVRNSALGLSLFANGVSASFFTYPYPLLDELQHVNEIPLAGISDIGVMKVEAVAERGARKDFVDLYFIAKHVSLDALFEASKSKYPGLRFFETRALEGLVEFEAADTQRNLKMVVPIDWEEIKRFFRAEAIRLGKKRFEDL